MGHIATAWSALQISDGQTTDTAKARYMWAASIVEVSLRWMIDLWEARNEDVHDHTETEQNSRLKENTRKPSEICLQRKSTCDHAIIGYSQTILPCS
mmetsp:Transcript_21026/g.47543  ORF Transcript_21026/g.47543 Transcript_21026/m.47543 type:complete len:97 (-) Transcript_21026:210-500(-)